MVEKIKNYIEHGSWEEDLERQFDLLDRFCWAVILVAACYFGPALWQIIMREVGR